MRLATGTALFDSHAVAVDGELRDYTCIFLIIHSLFILKG
jgi:hypothetical protein